METFQKMDERGVENLAHVLINDSAKFPPELKALIYIAIASPVIWGIIKAVFRSLETREARSDRIDKLIAECEAYREKSLGRQAKWALCDLPLKCILVPK